MLDEAVWMRFYPITYIKGGYHRFPISENEKYVLDEAVVSNVKEEQIK